MEVTISTTRAGIDPELVDDVVRISQRSLIPHNIERQIALALFPEDGPALSVGDLVVERSRDPDPGTIMEVEKVDEGTVLAAPVGGPPSTFIGEDLIVFDLVPQ